MLYPMAVALPQGLCLMLLPTAVLPAFRSPWHPSAWGKQGGNCSIYQTDDEGVSVISGGPDTPTAAHWQPTGYTLPVLPHSLHSGRCALLSLYTAAPPQVSLINVHTCMCMTGVCMCVCVDGQCLCVCTFTQC